MASLPTPSKRAADDPASTSPEQRTPQDVAALLRRPFADGVLKQKPTGGGAMVTYAPIASVIERLNRACAEWHWRVITIEYHVMPLTRKGKSADMLVAHVTGELVIPGLGARQAVGTAPVDNEDAAKIAESDAIKRAASAFGVPCGR